MTTTHPRSSALVVSVLSAAVLMGGVSLPAYADETQEVASSVAVDQADSLAEAVQDAEEPGLPEGVAGSQSAEDAADEAVSASQARETTRQLGEQAVDVAAAKSAFALPLPAQKYRVSSYFGNRCPSTLGSSTYHGALDLAADDGTAIDAMAAGRVSRVTEANGNVTPGAIYLDHGTYKGKSLETVYTHMWDATKYVDVGDRVKKGQRIGDVGASGVANGPHLHLNVRYGGTWMDPLEFFQDRGLDLAEHAYEVAKNTPAPDVCGGMQVHSRLAVREKPNHSSDLVEVLGPRTIYGAHSGPGTNGFAQVELQDGRSGWAWIGNLTRVAPDEVPQIDKSTLASNGTKDAVYRMPSGTTRYLRDMPSYEAGINDIMVLADHTDDLVSTGRIIKGTDWAEFSVDGVSGWMKVTVNLTEVKPAPKPEPTETATPKPEPEPTETATPKPEPTETATPKPEPTETATPKPEPTPSPTKTATPKPTPTQTESAKPTVPPLPEPLPWPVPTVTAAPPKPEPSYTSRPIPTFTAAPPTVPAPKPSWTSRPLPTPGLTVGPPAPTQSHSQQDFGPAVQPDADAQQEGVEDMESITIIELGGDDDDGDSTAGDTTGAEPEKVQPQPQDAAAAEPKGAVTGLSAEASSSTLGAALGGLLMLIGGGLTALVIRRDRRTH